MTSPPRWKQQQRKCIHALPKQLTTWPTSIMSIAEKPHCMRSETSLAQQTEYHNNVSDEEAGPQMAHPIHSGQDHLMKHLQAQATSILQQNSPCLRCHP